jgi:WD40 repeat protein
MAPTRNRLGAAGLLLLTPLSLTLEATARPDPPSTVEPPSLRDRLGDPLPPSASARLGSARWRHGGAVETVAVTPDDRFLVSAGHDGMVRVWAMPDGRPVRQVREDWASCAAVSSDGAFLAVGSGIGAVTVWELATGEENQRLGGGELGRVNAVGFSADGETVAAACADGSVRLWDPTNGREVRKLDGHQGEVLTLAFAPDELTLATAGGDGTVRLWELESGRLVRKIEAGGPVTAVAHAPDGQTLYAVAAGRLRSWEPATGRERPAPEGPTDGLTAVAVAPDGKRLAAVGPGRLQVWNLPGGKKVGPAAALSSPGCCLAFAAGGGVLAVGDGHGRVSLYDPATGALARTGDGRGEHSGAVTLLGWAADGRSLISAEAGAALVWDVPSGLPKPVVRRVEKLPRNFVAGPGGRPVEVELTGDGLHVREIDSGRSLGVVPDAPADRVSAVALAADGTTLAVASGDSIRLADLKTGRELRRWPCPARGASVLAFSPDGTVLAAVGAQGPVRLWECASGRKLRQLPRSSGPPALAFAPDGRSLAVGERDGLVVIWEVATGRDLHLIQGHAGTVGALAFAADGRALASAGSDGLVRVWEVGTGLELAGFAGHAGAVTAVAFGPGGRSLASGGAEGTVVVWDLAGQPAAERTSPSAQQIGEAWASLVSEDGPTVRLAQWRLALAPEPTVPELRSRLRWLIGLDARRIEKLLAELDAPSFAVRESASQTLTKLVAVAEPTLRRALATSPSAEVRRRLERILENTEAAQDWSRERLRVLRVIAVLERAGTPAAVELLTDLARAAPEPELMQESQASLDRLTRKAGRKP